MRWQHVLILTMAIPLSVASAVDARAADGFMVRVTAASGEIKLGNRTLARVPRGEQLWVFEVKDRQWARVKVPGGEEKGWIYYNQCEAVKLSDTHKAQLKDAYVHYDRYQELITAQRLAEATAELSRCLKIEQEVHGRKHPDVANTLNNLGALVSDQGDYAAARKYYEEALATYRKFLGNVHADTANTLNNLGNLVNVQGDHAAARKYYDEALAIKRKVLGNEHTSTAMTLNNLGNLVKGHDDYAAARKYYEEALAIQRKLLGNEHTNTAMTLYNLGGLFYKEGDYAAARKYYDEALAIYRKVLGNEHTSTAMTLNNLGVLVSDQGDSAAARKYYDEALAIYRKVLGNEHTSTADTLNNLGNLVSDQDDSAAARKHYEEALAIYRKALGNEHTRTAEALNNLGNLVSDQGDYAAARKYYEEALAIQRKLLGNEHTNTAMTLYNLGGLFYKEGDYAAARKYYEEALAICRKVLGNEHTSTAITLNNLGRLFYREGDYAAARKHYEAALAIYRKVLGNVHTRTAEALNNLGVLVNDQGDYAAARKYYEEALAIKRKVLGNEHTSTAMTLENLAWLNKDEGDAVGAAAYLDQSRRAVLAHEMRILPALSEQEQLQFLKHNHHPDWSESLSFGLTERANPEIVGLSVGWLMNGKALVEESLAAGAHLDRPENKSLLEELRVVRRKLAEQVQKPQSAERDRQIVVLEAEQQQLTRRLASGRADASTDDPWISTDQLRAVLPAGGLLVNLARFEPWDFKTKKRGTARYVAWLIPPAGAADIKIVDLGAAEPIDAAVSALRKALGGADEQIERQGEEAAHQDLEKAFAPLVELVWQPLAEHVADAQELILSPDGALWLAPWAALPIDEGKFLIEKYQVRYVVSGRELVARTAAGKQASGSMILANPDFELVGGGAAPATGALDQLARRSVVRLDRAQPLWGRRRKRKASRRTSASTAARSRGCIWKKRRRRVNLSAARPRLPWC